MKSSSAEDTPADIKSAKEEMLFCGDDADCTVCEQTWREIFKAHREQNKQKRRSK